MGMFADLHTHTALCRHAEGKPEEYFRAAAVRGLRYLGVSDHIPWPEGYDPECRMAPASFPEYRAIVDGRKKLPSKFCTASNWTGSRDAWTKWR